MKPRAAVRGKAKRNYEPQRLGEDENRLTAGGTAGSAWTHNLW